MNLACVIASAPLGSSTSVGRLLQRAIGSVQGVEVVVDTSPHGVSAARNAGVLRTDAEYVAFLDDDDYWLPSYMDAVARYDTDVIVVGADCNAHSRKCMFHCLANGSPITPGSGLVVRRSAFDAVGGFDEYLRRHEVYAICAKLWKRGCSFSHTGGAHWIRGHEAPNRIGSAIDALLVNRAYLESLE